MLHAILCLAPILALAIPLLVGRYPGERSLVAMRSRPSRERWPRPRSAGAPRRRVLPVAAHGGLLIARALAVRPPPALLAPSS